MDREARSENITIRVTPTEFAAIKQAADKAGISRSSFAYAMLRGGYPDQRAKIFASTAKRDTQAAQSDVKE